MSDKTDRTQIRDTAEYAAALAEMHSWHGRLELCGSDGVDPFGREKRWAMSAYEHWAESIVRAVLSVQNDRDVEYEVTPPPQKRRNLRTILGRLVDNKSPNQEDE